MEAGLTSIGMRLDVDVHTAPSMTRNTAPLIGQLNIPSCVEAQHISTGVLGLNGKAAKRQ